jgi:soluble lytic murein transglycosylase
MLNPWIYAPLAFLFLSSQTRAMPTGISVSTTDSIPRPRWIYSVEKNPPLEQAKSTVKGGDIVFSLQKLKSSQIKGDGVQCLDQAMPLHAKAKSLTAWITAVELDCAAGLAVSEGHADRIFKLIEGVRRNPSVAFTGTSSAAVRLAFVKTLVVLIDMDSKVKRSRAWADIEAAEDFIIFMDDKTQAKYWRIAGELAFLQQKPEAAKVFFKRSLVLDESDEIRVRLKALMASDKTDVSKPDAKNSGTDASQIEIDLADKVTNELKDGEFVPAVDDAVKIIRGFPGSTRAKWASDRAFDAYISIIDKAVPKEPSLVFLREQVRKLMLSVDSDRLSDWARALYSKGFFQDAFEFGKKSLQGIEGARRTKALEIAASSALAVEDFDSAWKWYQELADKSSGQPASREALLHVGLIEFRRGQYAQAIAQFEKLLSLSQIDTYEVPARYWLWRALEKLKSERAANAAEDLMKKYPFTYYGLRARYERNSGVLDWKPETGKVESKIWVTGPQRLAWEKFLLLLRAGWLDEAQAELRDLPVPANAADKAVRSTLWAAAGGFLNASKLASEAWDEDGSLRRPPFTDSAYPHEFTSAINKEADERGVDRDLVRGLIKQESGYNVHAISPSNAMGLMQMIPPTAHEIAVELKLGPMDFSKEMFDPNRNIKMGTYYVSKMLKKYQGQVPLALAAYNAGPARMDRWLAGRPSLKDLAMLKSSDYDHEIWIDEIPYAETCFYVKAILRNILIYKMLDRGRVEVGNPIWETK